MRRLSVASQRETLKWRSIWFELGFKSTCCPDICITGNLIYIQCVFSSDFSGKFKGA